MAHTIPAGDPLLEASLAAVWSGRVIRVALQDDPTGPQPAQLLGRPTNSGISAAGPAMENQMHQPATAAGEQLSGNPLLGPGQITTTTGCDHK